ncbi:hypothetical protein HDG33_004800 [Paraburkholderia sp. Cpub6]|nr:hypothetical protein [Paraburkholderia sp. Cpub6]
MTSQLRAYIDSDVSACGWANFFFDQTYFGNIRRKGDDPCNCYPEDHANGGGSTIFPEIVAN